MCVSEQVAVPGRAGRCRLCVSDLSHLLFVVNNQRILAEYENQVGKISILGTHFCARTLSKLRLVWVRADFCHSIRRASRVSRWTDRRQTALDVQSD